MYALIIKASNGTTRVEEFDSPYSMSRAHSAYGACGIHVTPTIDGEPCYATMNMAGVRSYTRANASLVM